MKLSFSFRSVPAKLFLINVLILITFSIIALVVFLSFRSNKTLLSRIFSTELGYIIENSRTGRELGKIISDTTFLMNTFYRKDDVLKTRSENLIKAVSALSAKNTDNRQKESLNKFYNNIQGFIKQAATVNSKRQNIKAITQKIDDTAVRLGDMVSEKIITLVAEGQDISMLERLPFMISGYREILLRLELRFTELGLAYFEQPFKEQEHPLSGLSDTLLLRVRTLTAYDPDIAIYGKEFMSDIQKYKEFIVDFHKAAAELKMRTDEMNKEKNQLLILMEESDGHIAESAQEALKTLTERISERMISGSVILFLSTSFIIFFVFVLGKSISRSLSRVIRGLENTSEKSMAASDRISFAGRQLIQGTADQASSLEETSCALEKIASATQQNAGNANRSSEIAQNTMKSIETAGSAMQSLNTSMQEISQASENTRKIIKTIDEIAFRTNLLALNAAVEAARAGEAGAGFAVVASEVRNLAMQSSEAAQNTTEIIENNVQKINEGADTLISVRETFEKLERDIHILGKLIGEVAEGSTQQAQEIRQLNAAVCNMDQVVQKNVANGDELSVTSEDMNTQAKTMNDFIAELTLLSGRHREYLRKPRIGHDPIKP